MRNLIRKIVPHNIRKIIHRLLLKTKLRKHYLIDMKRFYASSFGTAKIKTKNNLEGIITYHTHAIEKGLSSENLRLGFGKNALQNLITALKEFNDRFDTDNIRYQMALATLNSYIQTHKLNNFNVDSLILEVKEITNRDENISGGVIELSKKNLVEEGKENFSRLAKTRYSVRSFGDEKIDKKTLVSALEISMKTPSVCNRQPYHIYIIEDVDLIKQILEIQNGLKHHKNISYLLLVVSDNSYLYNFEERNQGFVDGGLLSMSILYSLTFKGIASCALNADFDTIRDKKIRKLIGLPESQNMIMFIATGSYPDRVVVPVSYRDSIEKKISIIS